jgi:hypothetical protein
MAALSAEVADGRALLALDLDGAMVGTLELHAYFVRADGEWVEDTRLVIVDAPRQVAVAVAADQPVYRPGETARVQVRTTISQTGQGVQTALGIGVVDASVYALEEQPPGFVRAYFLMERELLERSRQAATLDPAALLGDDAALRAAQDVAARAAWAGARGSELDWSTHAAAPRADAARRALANWLGLLLTLLPLALLAVTLRGLHTTATLRPALRRVGIGLLALLVGWPLAGGGLWLLWAALGVGAPLATLTVVVALLAGLTIHGWRRRDVRVQVATGLLAAYGTLGGALVALAARGGDLGGPLLILVVAAFLLTAATLAVLGQGLVVEGWRRAGWAATALSLLLAALMVYLPLVPGLASGLTRTLGSPALYAGPLGWLAGCSPAMPPTLEAVPTEAPTEALAEPTAVAVATAFPTVAPTPEPPFPLRQVFPETLYWDATAVTDAAGNLTIELPLADSITTWRLAALASTRDGALGVATYDLVVFQDFFATLDAPESVRLGETVTATVTVYNYLGREQVVRVAPAAAEWYTVLGGPVELTLAANEAAAVVVTVRAERVGRLPFQVVVESDQASDAVGREIVVGE